MKHELIYSRVDNYNEFAEEMKKKTRVRVKENKHKKESKSSFVKYNKTRGTIENQVKIEQYADSTGTFLISSEELKKQIEKNHPKKNFELGRCRHCDKKIRWVTTPSGRRIPIEADSVTIFYSEDGEPIETKGYRRHNDLCPHYNKKKEINA